MGKHDHKDRTDPHESAAPHTPSASSGADESSAPVEANHHLQHRYPAHVRYCGLCGGTMELRTVLPDRKRLMVCERCGFVQFPGPKLVAGCLVIDARRVLLLRRGNEPRIGTWTFPGGYVDLGETPAQGAVRETLEEVGMRVALEGLLGVYADARNPIAAVVVYLARPGAEAPSRSPEALDVKYFAADEIPWGELSFATTHDALRDWVESALKK